MRHMLKTNQLTPATVTDGLAHVCMAFSVFMCIYALSGLSALVVESTSPDIEPIVSVTLL